MRNPHAAAVVCGTRGEIRRPWPTKHRGPILVHASQGFDTREVCDRYPHAQIRGAVLGFVEIVDCRRPRGGRGPAQWSMWLLGRAMAFVTPVYWPGELGEFDVPDDRVIDAIDSAIRGGKFFEQWRCDRLTAEQVYGTHRRSDGFVGD